jgi:hypothetical protein
MPRRWAVKNSFVDLEGNVLVGWPQLAGIDLDQLLDIVHDRREVLHPGNHPVSRCVVPMGQCRLEHLLNGPPGDLAPGELPG